MRIMGISIRFNTRWCKRTYPHHLITTLTGEFSYRCTLSSIKCSLSDYTRRPYHAAIVVRRHCRLLFSPTNCLTQLSAAFMSRFILCLYMGSVWKAMIISTLQNLSSHSLLHSLWKTSGSPGSQLSCAQNQLSSHRSPRAISRVCSEKSLGSLGTEMMTAGWHPPITPQIHQLDPHSSR